MYKKVAKMAQRFPVCPLANFPKYEHLTQARCNSQNQELNTKLTATRPYAGMFGLPLVQHLPGFSSLACPLNFSLYDHGGLEERREPSNSTVSSLDLSWCFLMLEFRFHILARMGQRRCAQIYCIRRSRYQPLPGLVMSTLSPFWRKSLKALPSLLVGEIFWLSDLESKVGWHRMKWHIMQGTYDKV